MGAGELSDGVGVVAGVRTPPRDDVPFSLGVIISEVELPPPEIISVSSIS